MLSIFSNQTLYVSYKDAQLLDIPFIFAMFC